MAKPKPIDKGSATGTNPTTATKTNVAVSSGSTLAVWVCVNGAAISISSVKWGTTNLVARGSLSTKNNLRGRWYTLYVPSGGTNDVVVTFNTNPSTKAVRIFECPGMIADATAHIDRAVNATGTSTSPNSGSTSATRAHRELVLTGIGTAEFGTAASGNGEGSWGAGITDLGCAGSIDVPNPTRAHAGYQVVTSKAAQSGGKTGLDASVDWVCQTLTLIYAGSRYRASATPAGLTGTGTTLSTTLTATYGNNGIAVALIVFKGTADVTAVSGVTLDGQAMEALASPPSNVAVYVRRGMDGNSGGNAIEVTLSSGEHKGVTLFAHAYDYVKQSAVPVLSTATGSDANPVVALTQADVAGAWFDIMAAIRGASADITPTPNGGAPNFGQTQNAGATGNSDRVNSGSQDVGLWTNSTTLDWTLSGSSTWKLAAVELESSDAIEPGASAQGSGATSAAARKLANASASAQGRAAGSAAARTTANASASTRGRANSSAAARVILTASASARGTGQTAAASRKLANASAAARGAGVTSAAGRKQANGSASAQGVARTSAAALRIAGGSASARGVGATTAAARVGQGAAATCSGLARAAAAAALVISATAAGGGVARCSATATVTKNAAAAAVGQARSSAVASVVHATAVAGAGSARTSTAAQVVARAAASGAGVARTSADPQVGQTGSSASAQGAARTSAAARVLVSAMVAASGIGITSAAAEVFAPPQPVAAPKRRPLSPYFRHELMFRKGIDIARRPRR